MVTQDSWKLKEIIIALFAVVFVLYVHGAIPFLMLPTLGQVFMSTGFSQSMAGGSLFDFYAHDFGIPKPAAIAFGLAGVWPASLLIRTGMHAADAYTSVVALWLGLAMFSAYRIARWFGGAKMTALSLAVVWMTMPIIWGHAGYLTVSLGMALLSFYFLAAIKLFLINDETSKISSSSIVLYAVAAIISVFMDGYTFMMFASGSSILLLYMLLTRVDVRAQLLKVAAPVHVVSFALAYALYSFYIGKTSYAAQEIDIFRANGLDLSFLAIPSKGVHWIPDLLGISVKRSMELYFADGSVWSTTFALPVLILGLLSWWRTRRLTKISTGILLVSMFGFYMALGPSLKINSVKPDALRSPVEIVPYSQYIMASEYALAPTGNAWISERLPGFNNMRASYRWSALAIFALWLLVVIYTSRADKKDTRVLLAFLSILFLLNLPDLQKRWFVEVRHRTMFQQVDQELVEDLRKSIRQNETVAFLPWGNDFMVNYLAAKVGFRTFNIGGDKHLADARSQWPQALNSLPADEIDADKAISSLKLLIDGSADVIVLPHFSMRWASYFWPCSKEAILCPSERRTDLQPVIAALRASPYTDVVEADLFTTVRLRPEFANQTDRLALLSSMVGSVQYPISIDPVFLKAPYAPYVLQEGWYWRYGFESRHVWSKSAASILLPIPKHCETEKCEIKLIFRVFGASPERPVDVFFNSAEQVWQWSDKIIAITDAPVALNIPLAGRGLRSINLTIPDATSPHHLTGSPDTRILGILLQRIELLNFGGEATPEDFLESEPVSLEEKLDFGFSGKGAHYLQAGWSDPENWGTWSASRSATIFLPTSPAQVDSVVIDFAAAVSPSHPVQRVDILVNGFQAFSGSISERSGTLEFKIPEAAKSDSFKGITMEFRLPDAASPKEMGAGEDTRTLALGLRTITLTEDDNVAALGGGKSVEDILDLDPVSSGEKLGFGSSGKGAHYLQAGWSAPEDWGTWSDSRSATVFLKASPAQVDSVVMDFAAAVSPSHPVQRVDILVNGSQAFSGSISERSGTIEFKIPDAAKSDSFKGITMEFRLPDAASPKEMGTGKDTRTLALGLRTITLKQQSTEDGANVADPRGGKSVEKILELEFVSPGEKLGFGSSAKGVHYLQAGWSAPEDWGTWSDSRSATVFLKASPAQVDSVVMDFAAAVSPSHPVQRVDILVNGFQAFSGSIKESGTLEFKMPDAAKSDAFKGITMEFRLPDAVRPKDIGLGEDTRTLALGLRAITLTGR